MYILVVECFKQLRVDALYLHPKDAVVVEVFPVIGALVFVASVLKHLLRRRHTVVAEFIYFGKMPAVVGISENVAAGKIEAAHYQLNNAAHRQFRVFRVIEDAEDVTRRVLREEVGRVASVLSLCPHLRKRESHRFLIKLTARLAAVFGMIKRDIGFIVKIQEIFTLLREEGDPYACGKLQHAEVISVQGA